MLADLIVGSGWPLGGKFLEEDETIQRVIVHKIPVSGGEKLSEDLESLYRKAVAALTRSYEAAKSYELQFIRLVPSVIQSTSEITDLTADFKKENLLEIKYTTVLSNYVMSLENNPTAECWTRSYTKIPAGLEGEVVLFSE